MVGKSVNINYLDLNFLPPFAHLSYSFGLRDASSGAEPTGTVLLPEKEERI